MLKLPAAARGDIPADLVIKNAKTANVFTGEYETADVAVFRGKIAGIAENYTGRITYDAQGRVLIPSLIDGHIHIEDTMLTPQNFALEAVKHGTGTVFADPHEIANALGMPGLEYMFKASQNLPVDIFYGAPSCVPASELETPFDELDALSVKEMFSRGLVQHLGEMMNFPAVINGDPEVWSKILTAGSYGVPLTGHAPGVSGKPLNAYLSSGISSDHEATTLNEAREKLRRGMWLMLREGSTFRDLRKLLQLIRENPLNSSRLMAVSDDITALYLAKTGHMDAKMRIMLSEKWLDPFTALRLVTLNPAEYFGLHDRGAIAPGRAADFALLDSDILNERFTVSEVWKAGKLVMRDNDTFTIHDNDTPAPILAVKTTRIPSPEDLRVKCTGSLMRVIGINEGTAITSTLTMSPKIAEGFAVPDTERDIAKIVVLDRHHNSGRYAVGFVKGMGIQRGAVGSSVAHDAH
ncbi:MAG: adenine deaminase, partial [Synergistaceae bacterium]|nr:adenine deaminase [Synergistaceae bacterium]